MTYSLKIPTPDIIGATPPAKQPLTTTGYPIAVKYSRCRKRGMQKAAWRPVHRVEGTGCESAAGNGKKSLQIHMETLRFYPPIFFNVLTGLLYA